MAFFHSILSPAYQICILFYHVFNQYFQITVFYIIIRIHKCDQLSATMFDCFHSSLYDTFVLLMYDNTTLIS